MLDDQEIAKQVQAAAPRDRPALLKRLLAEYEGDDKELIEPWLYEMIALDPIGDDGLPV